MVETVVHGFDHSLCATTPVCDTDPSYRGSRGMLALDVVHHRIQYIEVLHRPPLRRTSTA
ncbi:hypothetical protein [Streptomyces sp. NBC_00690]|uniref:hypothetical protein n=1 Tax=Streptomyces sp. NBC_00690 TaxID=2975808 RepID=UPI002E281135|nr:hypothetical protein [Streptomyces sp. NBC_00690]